MAHGHEQMGFRSSRDPPPVVRREPPPSTSKPSDPLKVPSAAEKFEAFLAQIRQMIREDLRKERAEEILSAELGR